MKRNILYIIILAFVFAGCNDFLDIKDESAINSDIWNSEESAENYVNELCRQCMPTWGGFLNTAHNGMSDEVKADNNMIYGSLASGSQGAFSATTYLPIRYINIAFDEIADNGSLTGDAYNNIEGQLYFLRAWQHWKMILMHGGVPYMRDVVGYTSDYAIKNAPRDKTSDCIKYLTSDLNKAIEMLPASWPGEEYGRVTRAAAAAFLGRVLLFYASPQFTPDQTGDVASERWMAAYNANLRADSICRVDGYGLLDCSVTKTGQWPVKTDINKIWWTAPNKEAIMVRVYSSDNNPNNYEENVRPGFQTGETGTVSNQPSLRLVMAFPNADGTEYTKDATDLYYWKDRDPRFYSTIVYNGCYLPYVDNESYRQWTYSKGDPSVKSTTTGYYCRKMLDPTTSKYDKAGTDWIEIRYAEVLLNLAESALEVGREDTMYSCLGQLRARAGIPEGDYYYGLKAPDRRFNDLELVMNERFIELAFENKRFFDLRRRNMFTEDLGPNIKHLNNEYPMTWAINYSYISSSPSKLKAFEEVRDGMSMDDVSEVMKAAQVSPTVTANDVAYRAYPDSTSLMEAAPHGSYNFFDISSDILLRSPAIKQTLGWNKAGEEYFNPFE